MKMAIKDIFLKQIQSIQKIYLILIKIYHFYLKDKKIEKVEKLVCDTNNKEKYVFRIRGLKQALNHGLVLKEVHRVIQFKQKAWTKKDIDKNTKLRKKANNEFQKKIPLS